MQDISKLDQKGLREFGLLTGLVTGVVFGLLIPLLRGHSLSLWLWIVTVVLWVLALLIPTALEPVYQIWMRIGLVLGWINTRLFLGVVFYALIMPIGILMRWVFHRDPMARKFDEHLSTYRLKVDEKPRKSMEEPF